MKIFLRIQLVFCLLLAVAEAVAAPPVKANSSLDGYWKGLFRVPSGTWDLALTIVPLSNGTLHATLDVPSQQISRMLTKVEVRGSEVTLRIPEAGSRFVGQLSADKKKMTGVWYQPGIKANVVLENHITKLTAANFRAKPPYREEEVVVPNKVDKIRLTGTLTMPQGKGPFPAVVLVSDSGPQERDATVDNFKMFGILADYLTRRGIAVLRYDDRGVGKSTGNYASATTADLVSDAQAAMGFLRAHYKINKTQVGMIGHGEGANVALLAASEKNAPNYIVSLAGYGLPGQEILKRQQVEILRMIGANPNQVLNALKFHQQMLDVIRQTPDNNLARAKVSAMMRIGNADMDFSMLHARANQLTSPWYRYFIDFDPRSSLKKVKCPVMVLNGTNDLLVAANKNLPALQKGLKTNGNRSVFVSKLIGANHWFQSDPDQWPIIDGRQQATFAPKALELIHDWVEQYSYTPPPAKTTNPRKLAATKGGKGVAASVAH
ncbi:alpha/beta hydrolase family protein [Hymenobacter koreensis]|uniref:Alpha/beta fold hydrolase n=1 Tax=Hymenobacter koreensis TaxID=1084523 RepID=A0ABP8IXS1_9BACT